MHWQGLSHLGLASNGISDEGARRLADALRGGVRLESLDLSENDVTDAGAGALSGLFGTCERLLRVDLHANRLLTTDPVLVRPAVKVVRRGRSSKRRGAERVRNALLVTPTTATAGSCQCQGLSGPVQVETEVVGAGAEGAYWSLVGAEAGSTGCGFVAVEGEHVLANC